MTVEESKQSDEAVAHEAAAHEAPATDEEAATVETTEQAAVETTAADAAAPEAAPLDVETFVAQVSGQPLADADAAMKALAAERGAEAAPALAAVARQGSLELAQKAMDVLVSLRSQEAADALATLGADRSNAQTAKEARRALHRLNLAGIKAGAPAPVARPEPAPDKLYACMASPIDGEGTRSITIVRQNRYDTLRLGVFILNEKLGVVDALGSDPCSMSLWKRYLADANDRAARLVPVELAFGQKQIEIAVARNERSKTPLPQRYYMFYGLAVGASEERPRPADLDPDAVRANPDLLAKSADLVSLPECETWLFPFEDMRSYALKVIAEERRMEQQQSELQIMDLGQVQREGAVVSVAMSELLDGSRRALYEERLEYTADILWRADRIEQAQWALAAALAMSQGSTLPLEQHPFLRAVVNHSLDLAVRAEKASPGGTLPSQGAAEKTKEVEEYVDGSGLIRRKSGLILPR